MAWTDGDLKILAAGMAIGGKWNLGGVEGNSPTCWNDEGQYDHFYIDFKRSISDFTYGQFNSSVYILGATGFIKITDAKKYSNTVALVYADISTLSHGVIVVGKSNSWIKLLTGGSVPKFISMFYVNGLENYIDLAYLLEQVKVVDKLRSEDVVSLTPVNYLSLAPIDHVLLDTGPTVVETVTVSYFSA